MARSCRLGSARAAYVLLETVVATGLLVAGLAVIGAQVQDAESTVRQMERRIRAMMLAERHLAELDLGLIELDSVDELQEGDFGPRYPDYAWWLTIEKTALEEMFLLRVDVFHLLRDDDYEEDDFDFDSAELVYTVYAMRPAPRPLNFAEELGLNEEQMQQLTERLSQIGVAGLDPTAFDPKLLGKLDFEELLEVLPSLLGAFGIDLSQLSGMIPPDVLQQIQEAGLLDDGAASDLMDALGQGGGS